MSDLHPTGINGIGKPLDRKSRIKRGLKWWFIDLWYVHVIALIVIVLCVTLPLVYVGYPRISQHQIDHGELNITSMSMTNPAPDGFQLELITKLTPHSIFHANLKPWHGFSYEDGSNQSFFDLEVPYTKTVNGFITTVDTRINLTSAQLPAWTTFLKDLLGAEKVQTWLVGKGQLKLGGLPTININYNKSLIAPGFNGLAGVTTTNLTLLTTAQPDGANLAGKVTIPNPTNGTLEMGDLTFGVSLPTYILNTTYPVPLGYATVNNTRLKPNTTDNVFDLRSVSNQTIVAQAVAANASLLTHGLPVTIVTRNVTYNGVEIPWLIEALAANPLQQILNISQALGAGGSGGGGLRRRRPGQWVG